MANLQSNLTNIAAALTESLLDVIRNAKLDELLAESGPTPTAKGRRTPRETPKAKATPRSIAAPKSKTGRLPRRSDEEIAAALDQVIALVKKNREGLRAEAIREGLGFQPKELPRILKEGLSTKKLKSKGQKRATTYFVA
jgi:hypothetical protein